MATGYKTCKVCGTRYEYCKTNRSANVFRWQDVTCCPEHGAEYFARIIASRMPQAAPSAGDHSPAPVFDADDETDELFEEGFDDGEEELEVHL